MQQKNAKKKNQHHHKPLRGRGTKRERKERPSPWVTPKIMEMITILIKPQNNKLRGKESSWIKVSNHYLGATEIDFLKCSRSLDSPRVSTIGVTEDFSNRSRNSWRTVL
jgi:hypothetical protein